jgi:hypothetical protein
MNFQLVNCLLRRTKPKLQQPWKISGRLNHNCSEAHSGTRHLDNFGERQIAVSGSHSEWSCRLISLRKPFVMSAHLYSSLRFLSGTSRSSHCLWRAPYKICVSEVASDQQSCHFRTHFAMRMMGLRVEREWHPVPPLCSALLMLLFRIYSGFDATTDSTINHQLLDHDKNLDSWDHHADVLLPRTLFSSATTFGK